MLARPLPLPGPESMGDRAGARRVMWKRWRGAGRRPDSHSSGGIAMRTLGKGEFHGTRRLHHACAGLTLADSSYAPGHRLPLHAHEQPFFSLVLRGSFDERLERGSRRCVPTTVVFYGAHEPHAEVFGERGGRAFNVELGPEWIGGLREHGLDQPDGTMATRASELNWLATHLYASFLRGGSDLEAEELVLEMVARLGGSSRHGEERNAPPWLERVREILHERRHEVVRVIDLAAEAGVHPVHLARVFRRHLGCTFAEYQRRLRIEEACARLAGDESLSTIALGTGFSDQAHFTRRFKELVGMPPGRYRSVVAA